VEGLVPGDFYPFHVVGRRVLAGESIYNLADVSPFKYTPAFALAMITIAKLSKTLAWWIWCVGSVSLFCYSTLRLVGISSFEKLTPRRQFVIAGLAAVSAWHGIIEHLSYGQADMLLFGLFALSALALTHSSNPQDEPKNNTQSLKAGFWLSLCWISKPPSLVLGSYFLIQRQYRALGWAIVFTLLFLFLPIFYWGPSTYLSLFADWFAVLRDRQPIEFLTGNLNQGFAASMARWTDRPESFGTIFKLSILAALAITGVIWRKYRSLPRSTTFAFSYLLYMCVTPLSWRWITCAWLPVAFMVFSELPIKSRITAGAFLVYAVLTLFLQSLVAKQFGVTEPDWLSGWGLYTVGTLLLFAFAIWALHRNQKTQARRESEQLPLRQ